MVSNVVYLKFFTLCFLLQSCCCSNFLQVTQDQTSARANTLIDDADDIQKQLDNEARDRIKYGRPKTIWVFHFPTQFPEINVIEKVTRPLREIKLLRYRAKGNAASMSTKGKEGEIEDCNYSEGEIEDWNYSDQENWSKSHPDCGGRSQSPVDLPYRGLIGAYGARQLLFKNYDVMPKSLRLINDGKRLDLFGKWPNGRRPFIYGGAAHSRRYLFHSLTLHWPSEHKVAGLQYPLESQVTFVAAEYGSLKTAMEASVADPLAFLAISSLYKFANHSQEGLEDLLQTAIRSKAVKSILDPKPLSHFSPPFTEYACYQGSLTAPPCTEAVLWFVRGRTLPVTRELAAAAVELAGVAEEQSKQFRSVQPMNDRRVYFFNNQHKDVLE